MNPVTLQINLTPYDYRFCKYLLHYQLSILYKQVMEVLLVYDRRPRMYNDDELISEHTESMNMFLSELEDNYSNLRVLELDYSPESVRDVAYRFFGKSVPTHDFRGAPVYGYLYGLTNASSEYVFHLDSDMFLGGGSHNWIAEALNLMDKDPEIALMMPLSGPPHPDQILLGQSSYQKYGDQEYSYAFRSMSTRAFLLKKGVLTGHLRSMRAGIKDYIYSLVYGYSPITTLEKMISAMLQRRGMIRVDLLGSDPGLWTIHPSFRSETFYNMIPEIIKRIEENRLPETQLGYYNMVPEILEDTGGIDL